MDFDTVREGTGTREWADTNVNICIGCPNNCLYCYAAYNACDRFKYRARDQWHVEAFNKAALMTSYPAGKGVVMFPSSHDITPFNVNEYIRVARLILEKGNMLLIVSKPRIECIRKIIEELADYKEQILFRFTIGHKSEHVSKFWEPGAPSPMERVSCLSSAFDAGYRTSVSIEPMLGGFLSTFYVVEFVRRYVTDSIWIGKMNKPSERVPPGHGAWVQEIETQQRDEEILKLYAKFKDDPLIRWKDSIKAVVERK